MKLAWGLFLGGCLVVLAGCSGTEDATSTASPPQEAPTKAEQLAKLKELQEQAKGTYAEQIQALEKQGAGEEEMQELRRELEAIPLDQLPIEDLVVQLRTLDKPLGEVISPLTDVDAVPIQDAFLHVYLLCRRAEIWSGRDEFFQAMASYEQALHLFPIVATKQSRFADDISGYRRHLSQRQSALLKEILARKQAEDPVAPDLSRQEGETDQALYLRIQQTMREGRKLVLNNEWEKAYFYYTVALTALEALPPGFNTEIVATRRQTCREQLQLIYRQAAYQKEKADSETTSEEETATASSKTTPGLMSGMPAPMEGEQALFLKTVRQVQNARKYEEQGRLRPALAEYEAALKNMMKMAPELKHGDGGPDDDVRDAIRRLKRKVKK